ncbi:MAG: TIGR01458 family HAD-type hydrolase, partial [Gemmatimonadales bacterium]
MTSAFLFDLDGTLYTSEGVIPGAVDAVGTLRSRGVPLRFVTNTTRTSRRAVADRLASFGFAIADEELFTPAVAAGTVLHERRIELISPFVARELLDDLDGFSLCGGVSSQQCTARPGAVLIGDVGNDWTPALLN